MLEPVCNLLRRLVAFRTVSSASNLELIAFCQSHLRQHGVHSQLVTSVDGLKANLYATIGPQVAGGVVLSGHVDVVPVEGQSWRSDPWTLTERDGRLYGRGTADMKGFVAVVLAAVPHLAGAGLRRPIHLALSYDEEVGCKGGRLLIRELASRIPTPCAVVVGEPTRNRIANGHKSYTELLTRIKGFAVHSGRKDLGASAVSAAARMIRWLDEVEAANRAGADASRPAFTPGYTTLHCGWMAGGSNATTVAEHASFTTDIRAVPWEDPMDYVARLRQFATHEVQPELRSIRPDCGVEIEVLSDIPGLMPEKDGVAEGLLRSICRHRTASSVAYGTEAGLFQAAGWSTVVCGPGDILQAHRADEYIEPSQLAECAEMMQGLARSLT